MKVGRLHSRTNIQALHLDDSLMHLLAWLENAPASKNSSKNFHASFVLNSFTTTKFSRKNGIVQVKAVEANLQIVLQATRLLPVTYNKMELLVELHKDLMFYLLPYWCAHREDRWNGSSTAGIETKIIYHTAQDRASNLYSIGRGGSNKTGCVGAAVASCQMQNRPGPRTSRL